MSGSIFCFQYNYFDDYLYLPIHQFHESYFKFEKQSFYTRTDFDRAGKLPVRDENDAYREVPKLSTD